jgi:SAM-dependent methyltransferase
VPAERSRLRRGAAAGLWALAAAHVAEALALRRRAAALPALPRPGDVPGWLQARAEAPAPVVHPSGVSRRRPPALAVTVGPEAGAEAPARVVGRAGVTLAPGVGAAAAREMAATGLAVLDLVPAHLPAEPAIRLLRRVAPDRFARAWLYAPGGAHQALALAPSLAGRRGVDEVPTDVRGLARLTVRAQRHAPRAAGVRVTDLVGAVWPSPADRWAEIEESTAFARPVLALAPLVLAARAAHLGALTAGVLVAPAAGVAAALAWSCQPALVFGRRAVSPHALRPPELLSASVLRLPGAWVDEVRTAVAGWRAATTASPAVTASSSPPAPPVGDLFDDPVAHCPWCGSGPLAGRLDTTDVTRGVPGPVHLDECTACGHIFQNPALSAAGLERCYRDLYDGGGDEAAEAVFAAMGPAYERRIDSIARWTTPRALLDVGTGHGHFCLAARQCWPKATVDGLDQSTAIDEAQSRGWVDHGYRGAFPDLAGGLTRSYDVVTMAHYVEHTREPRRELAAAAKVLEPGGHVMIEVPDPESPWARRLGRCWSQWVQPQHLHFVPCANLLVALEDEGFDLVSVERAAAHLGGNLVLGLGQAVERLVPSPHLSGPLPSPARPAAGYSVRRAAVLAAAAPVATVALVADLLGDTVLRRAGGNRPGDAYRVVARRL